MYTILQQQEHNKNRYNSHYSNENNANSRNLQNIMQTYCRRLYDGDLMVRVKVVQARPLVPLTCLSCKTWRDPQAFDPQTCLTMSNCDDFTGCCNLGSPGADQIVLTQISGLTWCFALVASPQSSGLSLGSWPCGGLCGTADSQWSPWRDPLPESTRHKHITMMTRRDLPCERYYIYQQFMLVVIGKMATVIVGRSSVIDVRGMQVNLWLARPACVCCHSTDV